MGSYNVTCALTGLPISPGQPVRVLPILNNVQFSSRMSYPCEFFYGFALKAKYHDYGEPDSFENKPLLDLAVSALETSGHYRKVNSDTWLASSFKPLWSLVRKLEPFFVGEQSWAQYTASQRKGANTAFSAAQDFLQKLGADLQQFTTLEQAPTFTEELFELTTKNLPHPLLHTPVFSSLTSNGLFAQDDWLFMHEAAYTTLVTQTSKLKARHFDYAASPKATLRDYLANCLQLFLTQHPQAWARDLKTWGNDALEFYRGPKNTTRLAPLTSFWLSSEAPVIGQLFGVIPLETILTHISPEELLEFYLFCFGVSQLRTGLTKGFRGSQDDSFQTQARMMSETAKTLRLKK